MQWSRSRTPDRSSTLLRSVAALPRFLRLDADYSIGALDAVDADVGGVLQDLDRLDVMRIDSAQRAAGAGPKLHVVDQIEGLVAAVHGARASDLNGDAAVIGSGDQCTGSLCLQHRLDGALAASFDVCRRHRRGTSLAWSVAGGTAGGGSDGERCGDRGTPERGSHRTPRGGRGRGGRAVRRGSSN